VSLSAPALRNIVIVLVIAGVVAVVPGGGTAAGVVLVAVSLAFLGAIGWVASIMYREHRESLYLLGEMRRGLLYGAVGVLVITLTATSRLWSTSAGSVAWLVLVGAAVYTSFAVLWARRR
jgi:hypothetical protein